MSIVETRLSVWEALAGRAPGQPIGPGDTDVWSAVIDRINPARARPELRAGIETAELTSVRGVPYVMLRSPDDAGPSGYLRLSPEEWQLAELMDGSRTVARLVAEFAHISGRLAPDQVRRLVADLAANRMLGELPVDVFGPLEQVRRRPLALRLGAGLLAAARGRRMAVANVDPIVDALYRFGGRFFFTPIAAVLFGIVALAGFGLFAWTWWRGDASLFVSNGSFLLGAIVLLALNVVALAAHELGHALATKHMGRRVPAAGFLVYFGIPSVFVDTSDVWMAGRRARLRTTLAGPAAGLVLAGSAQIVGLIFPAVAPLAFKLAFAWYLNVLFNVNPLLALDGYYLLMDWLEIPNLRARGLAFVTGRLRRRAPRWSELDAEGRLVALYGTLAVLWLVIAANVFYRVWADRVQGLVAGLWHGGFGPRLLLLLVVGGLCAPLAYLLVGWLSRRLRRFREMRRERKRAEDTPRRLHALNRSMLGRLPAEVLTRLARQAHWERPGDGRQLVSAGGAQPKVFVVIEGALQGRRPGDPGGILRQHAGPGSTVGLDAALAGAPAALDWYVAGDAVLLAIPSTAVATAIGPLPGPPPTDRAYAEALFDDTPALTGLSPEGRMGMLASARSSAVNPGEAVRLDGPTDAVIIESGAIVLPDGGELRRGTMIGPVGEGYPGPVAVARTPVRLWTIPAMAGASATFAGSSSFEGADRPPLRPSVGVHSDGDYPPLAAPPGMPPGGVDYGLDGRFERRLWWLVLLLLLLAFALTAAQLRPAPAWAEMPADRVLLTAETGSVDVGVAGRMVTLDEGGRYQLPVGAQVWVGAQSRASLTFRGGAFSVLCAGSNAEVRDLRTDGDRTRTPYGGLELSEGRILSDTDSTSGAFRPLSLEISSARIAVTSTAPAWYAVENGQAVVSRGEVLVDRVTQPETRGDLDCGDGLPDPIPTPSGSPTPTPSPSPSPSPSASPSPSPSPSGSPTPSAPGFVVPTDDDDDDDNGGGVVPPPVTRSPTPGRPPTQPSPVPSRTTQPPAPTTPPADPTPTTQSPPPEGEPTISSGTFTPSVPAEQSSVPAVSSVPSVAETVILF
ncbi:putative peptide zinc metalloprotease protein [Catenuloplanes nepalensis]|uniref:Peptide zinc metalloprotease protein n=1 Tax=Catenuloplanes nepalensis TaxID=587533 RepID=A0ABT9N281_9ACTN|nr:M50 family metallopeptidase [Catenuloplanes nepalensis]MDP9797551.1 putative peptide zinc metalloprotease protein [Catenuloplanes nepalensis]